MRAAILGLSALIVLLSISIVVKMQHQADAPTGTKLDVGSMINDAQRGEQVVYREVRGLGRYLTYRVVGNWPAEVKRVPVKEIEVTLRDPRQPPERAHQVTYEHRITDHFWFPLMEPQAPDEKDRVWILRSIRRDEILLGDRPRACWRMDLIDPALPPDEEHVVAWVDETVPVFGLLKWQRRDETWELDSAKEVGR
jgi:hypothetical protein